jgi:hypothetical protein
MDQDQANADIATVDAAVTEAENEASTVSDPTLRAEIVKATASLRRAEQSWATDQLQEVLNGTKGDDWWLKYGTDASDTGSLISQAHRYVRDNSSFYTQWSNAINNAAAAATDVISFTTEHIAEWQAAIEGYKEKLAAFQTNEEMLQGYAQVLGKAPSVSISTELKNILYGTTAQQAADYVADFSKLLDYGEDLLNKMQAGATFIFSGGDVHLAEGEGLQSSSSSNSSSSSSSSSSSDDSTSSDDSSSSDAGAHGLVQLGVLELTGGIVIAGIVAVIALLGTIALWLESYYAHANRLIDQEDLEAKIAAAKDPNISEGDKKKILDLKPTPPPDPFKTLWEKVEEAGAVIVGGGLVVVAGGFAWRYREEIKAWIKRTFGRRQNPHKRKRRRYA